MATFKKKGTGKVLMKIQAFVILALFSGLVMADPPPAPQYTPPQDGKAQLFEKFCVPGPNRWKQEKCDELQDSIIRGSYNSSSGGCTNVSEELSEAQGAFMTACSNMGLPNGVAECAKAVDKCKTQSKSEKKSYCPGAPDSDRVQKQLEKAEDRMDKLKEKLPELQEKLAEGTSESNNKIAELKQKGRDALTESTKAIRQAGRDKEEKQSKIVEQLAQVSSQILQIDEQIGQFELSKSDAAMKRDETKTQIDLNCHQTASATVSKLQSDALARLQSGTYSRGGQSSLLKNVGMSDRESWQKVAEKYYNWCLRSKPTIDSKTSANRMYTQAIVQTDKAIENAKKRKGLLEAQAARLKDPTGACGSAAPAADGSTGETETCRANRQAAEDMAQLRSEYEEKLRGLNEDIARTQQDGTRKMMAQQQALASAQRDLNDEKTRVNNLRSALDGNSTSKEEASDFRKAFAKWASAAQKADACCAKNASVPKPVCDRNEVHLEEAGYTSYEKSNPTAGATLPAADSVQGSLAGQEGSTTRTPRQPTSATTTTPRQETGNTNTPGEAGR